MNKTYNGPQSHLMNTLMEKTKQHGEINCTDQVYLARGCLSIEKEYSILKWTREVPIEIGWYVMQTPDDYYPYFVEIVNDFGDWYISFRGQVENSEYYKNSDCVWYGPIPQIFEESTNSALT